MVKNLPANAGDGFLEKEMATHSIFLPGKSNGQINLEGYCPCDFKESDTSQQLNNSNSSISQLKEHEYVRLLRSLS